jgi:ABC-type Mn2+/Zn2+ transport system ATPase subunit
VTASVEAAGLAIGYGHRPVVRDIDLALAPGSLLVLIGTNGSGKSTLIKTLAGLIPPIAGAVRVLGAPPGTDPHRVAYLPQHPVSTHTLPLRVRDVVMMGRYARVGLLRRLGDDDRSSVDSAMERTGITNLATRSIRDLSGGQQQRTHLAQVLARRSEVLLLDEPTAGLDIGGRAAVARLIAEERSRGVTVVLATHELSDADDADLVMLLAQRVVALAPPIDALTDANLRACFGFTQPH